MIRAAITAALATLASCSHRTTIDSCDDELDGSWRSDTGQRWMIIDNHATLEGYPLFDDTRAPAPAGLEVAPRVLDLTRGPQAIDGEMKRRYLRAADACIAKAPAHVTACGAETLELVLADPTPPLGFAPCSFGRPESSRRERWHRE